MTIFLVLACIAAFAITAWADSRGNIPSENQDSGIEAPATVLKRFQDTRASRRAAAARHGTREHSRTMAEAPPRALLENVPWAATMGIKDQRELDAYLAGLRGENIDQGHAVYPFMPFSGQWDGRMHLDDAEKRHGLSSLPNTPGSKIVYNQPKYTQSDFNTTHLQHPSADMVNPVLDKVHPLLAQAGREVPGPNRLFMTSADLEKERMQLDEEIMAKHNPHNFPVQQQGAQQGANTAPLSEWLQAVDTKPSAIQTQELQPRMPSYQQQGAAAPVLSRQEAAMAEFSQAFEQNNKEVYVNESEREAMSRSAARRDL